MNTRLEAASGNAPSPAFVESMYPSIRKATSEGGIKDVDINDTQELRIEEKDEYQRQIKARQSPKCIVSGSVEQRKNIV
jgi:hypothetical protein